MKNAKYNKAFSLIEISIVIVIIGILIAGITQGSRIVRSATISSAQSLTRSSPAASIKDIFLWLDSTSEDVFINENNNTSMENGDCIETWKGINPQSTDKYFFYNNHPTLCPLYAEKGINKLPSLYFNTNSGTTDTRFFSKDKVYYFCSSTTNFQ